MDASSQDNRLIRLNVNADGVTLLPLSFAGTEGFSTPFRFRIECFSPQEPAPADTLAGKAAVISLSVAGEDVRHFHGYVTRILAKEHPAGGYRYELTVEPWLRFLDYSSDCRVFRRGSVRDIAETLFAEFNFADVEWRLTREPAKRDFCVQYNETALAFLSRLWEEEGIFYFFRHEADRHVLTLCDSSPALPPSSVVPDMRYHRDDVVDEGNAVSQWHEETATVQGVSALSDYAFMTPQADLAVYAKGIAPPEAVRDLERYGYPGRFQTRSEGAAFVRLRMEEAETRVHVCRGKGNAGGLAPGFAFALKDHHHAPSNRSYVVTEVMHEAQNNYDEGKSGGATYSNVFVCIPAETPFRPPLLTPVPRIYGLQTAVVVGEPGDDIHTDRYGCVKVQFHWDRRGKADGDSSCWVRVAQRLSGARWGMFALPRVGMEALVEFAEGNPDRPYVTGCVPNADNLPPYDLPAHKTRSGFKSNSTPGGGGFNEIRFEDKKGAEQLFLHAQRNMDTRVRADSMTGVGGSLHVSVGGDRKAHVKGSSHDSTDGDRNEKIGGDYSLTVADTVHATTGGGFALRSGSEIMIEAGARLTLRVGGSFISLSGSEAVINAPKVLINSGGAPGALSASPEAPAMPSPADGAVAGGAAPPPRRQVLPLYTAKRETITQRQALKNAAQSGAPFCEICQAAAGG